MDKVEAHSVLQKELESYRSWSYEKFVGLINKQITNEVEGDSGVKYQIEIQVFWDNKTGENIRVLGSIDDGGWRAFMPLSDAFILAPNGMFIGE